MHGQYIHQATYGNIGAHRAGAQFVVRNNHAYATEHNKDFSMDKPIFRIQNGKWYRTVFHPEGESLHPVLETRGNKIHTTPAHPHHNPSGGHLFELKKTLM